MPIYEFRCACGRQFEKLCRMNEQGAVSCPACGEEARRIMSSFRTGGGSGEGGSASGSSCGSCSSSSCSSC